MQGVEWKRFALAAIAIIVIGNLANKYFDRRDQLATEQPQSIQATNPELRILASSQSADGVEDTDFTPQLADEMAKYGVGRLTSKMEAIHNKAGGKFPPPQIWANATVVNANGKTLVIVRYEINAAAKAVEVLGVSGPNLDRVMCTRESMEEILITSGPCAQKLLEIHGVRLGS